MQLDRNSSFFRLIDWLLSVILTLVLRACLAGSPKTKPSTSDFRVGMQFRRRENTAELQRQPLILTSYTVASHTSHTQTPPLSSSSRRMRHWRMGDRTGKEDGRVQGGWDAAWLAARFMSYGGGSWLARRFAVPWRSGGRARRRGRAGQWSPCLVPERQQRATGRWSGEGSHRCAEGRAGGRSQSNSWSSTNSLVSSKMVALWHNGDHHGPDALDSSEGSQGNTRRVGSDSSQRQGGS